MQCDLSLGNGGGTTASFDNFLSGMGWKVKLKHHRARGCFMGGLDCSLHTKMLYYGSSMREVSFHVVPWIDFSFFKNF